MSRSRTELEGLLDDGGPAPDAASFASIVARRDRRSVRRLRRVAASAVAVAVASLAVGGLGLARATGVRAPSSGERSASGPAGVPIVETLERPHRARLPAADAASPPVGGTPAPLHLLVERTGPVAVHGYLVRSAVASAGRCATPGALVVEVADAGAVAQVDVVPGAIGPGPRGFAERRWLVGEAEGAPMALVVGRAGRGVRRVELSLPGGRRIVASPQAGWVVLAGLVPPPGGEPGTSGAKLALRVVGDHGTVLRVVRWTVDPSGTRPVPACAKLVP